MADPDTARVHVSRARVENWQQYQALNAQEWALLTERYDLLADMP